MSFTNGRVFRETDNYVVIKPVKHTAVFCNTVSVGSLQAVTQMQD